MLRRFSIKLAVPKNEPPVYADEFEMIFAEQRKAVEENNIPLFDRLKPDTKKLFTAVNKHGEHDYSQPSKGNVKRRRSAAVEAQTLTYSHYVN